MAAGRPRRNPLGRSWDGSASIPARQGPRGEILLGFRLRKPGWGQGFATEGSRALVRKGFTELGARRVVAETMAVNLASRRVLEKTGLHVVRVFHQSWPYRVDGRELGDVEYALTKDEWDQQNGITAG
jgi:RimJ/RimL family protein N-acetyltransferase